MKKFPVYLFLYAALAFAPITATAALIEYNGYELDTETNIVTGGGLEWLRWDQTLGMSYTNFLGAAGASYRDEGFILATQTQMSSLFSVFFPDVSWDNDATTSQFSSSPYVPTSTPHSQIRTLFGSIPVNTCTVEDPNGCWTADDPRLVAWAFYGYSNDSLSIASYGSSGTLRISEGSEQQRAPFAQLTSAVFSPTIEISSYSLALVRTEPVAVPEPSTLGLLSLALGMLLWLRRRIS